MPVANFSQMIELARRRGPARVVVAAAADPEVLTAVAEAWQAGIAQAILVGDEPAIRRLQDDLELDLGPATIVQETGTKAAAARAVALVAAGEADVLAKGQLKTEELLGAALRKDGGIRREGLLTHVGIFEIPTIERLIYISDSGVVLYPDVWQKLEITRNVVEVAGCFGLPAPKVALLAAGEELRPDSPISVEMLAVARMAQQGWIEGAIVDGPLSLDAAVHCEAARLKGVAGPVAGRADILIVPNVETGNIMAKSIQYLAHGRMAGLVVGARVPILISSRADTAETRVLSLAMAAIIAGTEPERRDACGH
jgi:phosphate butyryltransferase